MSEALKTAASLSLSGSLLILVLFLCKPVLKERLSRRWQYYIWLAVVARLLLPFSPEAAPVGTLFREPQAQPVVRDNLPYAAAPSAGIPETGGLKISPELPAAPAVPSQPPAPQESMPDPSLSEALPALEIDSSQALLLIWLGGALFLLVRKATVYQSFVRCIRAGCREVSDPALLDRLAQAGGQVRVRHPVELMENPLAASPMLLGLLRPVIVLPSADLPEADFRYTVLHELTHYRRGDLIYKWLVQLTVCLHWFNPLVWLMAREIGRACELACDEAVLRILNPEERRDYGGALLRALEAGGAYASVPGSATLGENAELLKERLHAIMKFKKQSKRTVLLSLILTAALVTGAIAAGAYTGPAKGTSSVIHVSGTAPSIADLIQGKQETNSRAARAAEECYQDADVSGFSVSFAFLNKEEQVSWLERTYTDESVSFFSVCLSRLLDNDLALAEAYAERAYADERAAFFSVCLSRLEDGGSALMEACAERAYTDRRISFFSIAAQYLDDKALDSWIARATKDGQTSFLSALLKETGRDEELDALEAGLEAKQLAEYEAHGVTRDGKDYYYRGQLVRIFLDARPNSSFYTLNTNPLGKVDIKIIRGEDQQIQGVAYMTREEVAEQFGDWAVLDEPAEMDTLDFRGTTYYLVFNEAQLRAIGTGRYGLDQNYLQQEDIQLSHEEWVPIGTAERPFTGSYNGNGFEIKGLTMTDPEAELVGLFGVGSGAEVYNVTLRDYDIASARRQASRKAVNPVLAQGLNGSKCYDNFLYPKELNGGTVIRIPVDYDRVRDGAYCWLGEYTLSVGDIIEYDISAETGNGLAIGFADMEHKPEEAAYCTVSNRRADGILQCDASFRLSSQFPAFGRLRLFLHATDGELGNVKGEITLTLAEGDQDFPEIPPLTANDILTLPKEELPAAAQRLLERCAVRTWYLIHSEGRQYVWYDGLPGWYMYTPAWEDGGWQVAIRSRRQTGPGYVLLSFPDGIPLTVAFDGETVHLTEIGAYSQRS